MILNELFLNEQANEVAIIFGRFNPPHKGHRAAWEMASESTHWYVGTNKSTQGPKDPLPYDVKLKAMLAVWPGLKGHIVAEQSWLTMAAMVYKKHGAVTLVCCTDEDWVTKTIRQYNGVEGQHGIYKFADVVQKPTPRLSSATALRAAVRAGDRDAFADAAGVPADTPVAGKPFFDLVDHYLSQYPEKVKEGWRGALAGAALAGAVGAGIVASPKIHVNGETYDKAVMPAPADAKTVTVDGKTYKVWKKWHQGPKNPGGEVRLYQRVDEDAPLGGHEPGERKFRVQYDIHGSNRDVPLYTKTRTVWAKDEKEAISRLQKLVGGRNHKIVEAAYPGNIGAMEMAKFFQVATPEQKRALKQALEQKDTKTVWDMLKSVTGIKLHDVKFTEGLAKGQAAWKKEMQDKGAVKFKRDQHGGGAVDRIVAYDKDGKVVGGFNRKVNEDAAGVGVIASKKQARDPRYSMSLTKDVRPGEVERSLRKLRLR